MNLSESSEGPVKIISVGGRLDTTAAPALGERLASVLDTTSQRVLLELSDLEYISSAGFRVLLIAAKRATETDGRIALSGVAGNVRRTFEIAGFLRLFRVCGTRDEGITALR